MWSMHRSRQVRQKEWPHGVVTGCHMRRQHRVHSKSAMSTLPGVVGLSTTLGWTIGGDSVMSNGNVSIHLVKKRNMKGIFTFEPFQVGHDPVHHLVQFRVNLVVVDGQGHHPLGRVAHHFIFILRFGCRSNDGGCGP